MSRIDCIGLQLPLRAALVALVASAAACSSGDTSTTPAGDDAMTDAFDDVLTDAQETAPLEAEPGTDSGETDAAGSDSGAGDTWVDPDAGDTAAEDTLVTDSSVADTFVADTFVADTFVADTFVADTSAPDTYVADTYVADTYVADTYVADTYVPDSGTVSCEMPTTAAGGGGKWYTTLSTANIYLGGVSTAVRPCFVEFEPAYPLWSDGLHKRRWIYLPPGTKIETGPNPVTGAAPNMDRWVFPVGTRFLKEFWRSDGKRLETRIWERTATGYRYGAFRWRADQSDADYTESGGPAALALDDGTVHEIPTRSECAKCHDGEPGKGLGFSAVSLSKPPLSTTDLTLLRVIARGWLSHPPSSLPDATLGSPVPGTAVEAKGLGYLHGNCAHCHNPLGVANAVDMQLRIRFGETDAKTTFMWTTSVGAPSKTWSKLGAALRIDPGTTAVADGRPLGSAVYVRQTLRGSNDQMPQLGTALVDTVGLKDLEAWIKGL